MNRKDFKRILKPLIKECIKEVIFEEGVLSTIVSEVIKGTNAAPVMQTRVEDVPVAVAQEQREEAIRKDKEKLQELLIRPRAIDRKVFKKKDNI